MNAEAARQGFVLAPGQPLAIGRNAPWAGSPTLATHENDSSPLSSSTAGEHRDKPPLTCENKPLTTRLLLGLVVMFGFILGMPRMVARQHSDFLARSSTAGLLSDLCENEYKLFNERASTCHSLAHSPWDLERDDLDLETLRMCPDQYEVRERGTWAEQAMCWERAARLASQATSRLRRKLSILPFIRFGPHLFLIVALSLWVGYQHISATSKAPKARLSPDQTNSTLIMLGIIIIDIISNIYAAQSYIR